ncbi:hypothetical protein [Novosphingobium sp. UBA1939]|uniref:hypothetical protein n=1 Tax=Novosphingobium sp. UBA1939 TaxID=1946982 RepID=UPI0025E4FB57|nr:hypothetical protein [Novosphingobium sp. UBA1939]
MRVHLITPVITGGIRTLDDVAPLMRDDLVITQSPLAPRSASRTAGSAPGRRTASAPTAIHATRN